MQEEGALVEGEADFFLYMSYEFCLFSDSSARNFMIYQRGTVGSFQKWSEQVGDESYASDNLLPYFKKSVNFSPPNGAKRFPNASAEYNLDAFSSTGRPLHVSYANYPQPFSTYMERWLHEIGIPEIQDFNSSQILGAQYCSSTIDPANEIRDSSQTSFLDGGATYTNLKVYTATRADKILFNSAKQVIGVQVDTADLPYILSATKETIICAGGFQSPQLLMVSGIGPASQLEAFDIPVITDRPGVGQNLTDHIFFGPTYPVSVQTFTRLANVSTLPSNYSER